MGSRVLVSACAVLGVVLSGCAEFPDEHNRPFAEQPSLAPQAGPQPSFESEAPPSESPGAPNPQPPPQASGCEDPDPAVITTCLDPVGAIAVLPDGQSALVGERSTGRVLRVQKGTEPVELARIPVDASSGGGLTGLALSPTYHEDELFYAYVTTSSDNQVVRVASGDRPKPVLTGIPKGSTGNAGALLDDGKGALLVATGNAGSPGNAADPSSLAGKLLRIDGFGNSAEGNPQQNSPVVTSGLTEPTGICGTSALNMFWVTDRSSGRDALYQVKFGQPLGNPAWTWADRPGVSGCAADPSTVIVALRDAAALYTLHPAPDGSFTGQPTKVLENRYGRFATATLAPDGLVWLGTTNRDGGRPVPSDDRVLRLEPPTGGTAGKD
ncbi:PQQ-dependent sugar dehydrogenase [Saccharopolyspora mangrovi]|uniref:PQQ-dependent sugar dehydrogenase n=1 Tax=Saccharopolyspora mangrovi TaxID=3082379 RepID=A0ABU6A5K6_9PSEU|nr:PQQ-dependent sugar dehydrogenase [Saccharopolyspora sp. S2-29]MEB3366755.1 PQQ-dependent sugar dehydrogenase [Saccharopolyspora sp. S2-29]